MKKLFSAFIMVSAVCVALTGTAQAKHYSHHSHVYYYDDDDDYHPRHRGRGHKYGHYKKHRYKHKYKHHRYDRYHYPRHVVIDRSYHYYPEPRYGRPAYSSVRCTNRNNPLGTLLGGIAGGAAGYQFGKGHGKTAATIGGAVLGGAFGNSLSQYCSEEYVYNAPIGTPVAWDAPRQNENYYVTATREYEREGRYCREYQAVATVAGRQQQTYGTACMQPDGNWEIVK